MTATGEEVVVTVCVAVSDPQPFVAVSVYVPAVETVIALAVAPVLQLYVLPPDAFSVTDPPVQKVVLPKGVIAATGSGFTVTVCVAVAVPQPLVAVSV